MDNRRLIGFFSGFPTHHFTDEIAETLRRELQVRESLVFISAWPSDFERNDDDSAGMHGMFAERGMEFARLCVIDDRTKAADAQRLVREASCIFLMGGHATLQMKLILEKGLRDAIRDSSAVVLGVSAGSINMGSQSVDIWESMTPYEGLELANLTVKAHFQTEDEELLQTLLKISMALPVCAMEDESAIFIKSGQIVCFGAIHLIDRREIKKASPDLLRQFAES